MAGQPADVVEADLRPAGYIAAERLAALVPHKVHPGSRPQHRLSVRKSWIRPPWAG